MEIRHRLATEKDIAACNDFYNANKPSERTVDQWRWEFIHPHFESLPYGLAEMDGRVVGIQGLIPVNMISAHGLFLTCKSEDSYVDINASLRDPGCFPKLYRVVLDFAREHGVSAIWGFTPRTSAFKRIGFTVPLETGQLVFTRLAFRFSRAMAADGSRGPLPLLLAKLVIARAYSSLRFTLGGVSRRRSAARAQLVTMQSATEEMEKVCREFILQWGGATILRDSAYMNWRLFRNPHVRPVVRSASVDGRLLGWVAYSVDGNDVGHIVDLMAASGSMTRHEIERVLRLLLSDAVRRMVAAGAVAIRAWTVTGHAFDRALSRAARHLGFLRVREGKPMVVKVIAPEAATRIDPAEWYISRIFTEGIS